MSMKTNKSFRPGEIWSDSNGVHVYSSRDLYNWRDEGIALSVSDDPKSDIVRGCKIERSKVVFNARTKIFVM
jgi:hypothetical protein